MTERTVCRNAEREPAVSSDANPDASTLDVVARADPAEAQHGADPLRDAADAA